MATTTASPSDLDPGTRLAIWRSTYEDLPTFVDLIFSQSFDGFVRGEWVLRRAEFLQSSTKTCDIGPRNHLKSTGFYAHFLWKLWRARFDARDDCPWADGRGRFEAHYFSYKQKSAGYHIGVGVDSIKSLIERNPWFQGLEDLKPTAETKGKWTWDREGHGQEITLSPHGMRSHVRGIHAGYVYVDDPFQDPENDLNPTEILKINNVFRAGVSSIPKTEAGDELHVTTTPQTEEDFVFDEDLLADYAYMVEPAIQDHASESVLWPEWMSYEDLLARKREIGPKLFNQEYMCSPKASELGFFTKEEIGGLVAPALPDWGGGRNFASGDLPEQLSLFLDSPAVSGTIAGLDIGKKQHPAHLAVFAVLRRWLPDPDPEKTGLVERPDGHLVQLHSKWMDSWAYTRQADYCSRAIEFFDIARLDYDNTRGEFESLAEQGRLHPNMNPVSLSGTSKDAMSGAFDAFAADGRLVLLDSDDGRQSRQLAVVTNDLDAVETNEGHGEPFTSIGLAVRAATEHHWGASAYSLEM